MPRRQHHLRIPRGVPGFSPSTKGLWPRRKSVQSCLLCCCALGFSVHADSLRCAALLQLRGTISGAASAAPPANSLRCSKPMVPVHAFNLPPHQPPCKHMMKDKTCTKLGPRFQGIWNLMGFITAVLMLRLQLDILTTGPDWRAELAGGAAGHAERGAPAAGPAPHRAAHVPAQNTACHPGRGRRRRGRGGRWGPAAEQGGAAEQAGDCRLASDRMTPSLIFKFCGMLCTANGRKSLVDTQAGQVNICSSWRGAAQAAAVDLCSLLKALRLRHAFRTLIWRLAAAPTGRGRAAGPGCGRSGGRGVAAGGAAPQARRQQVGRLRRRRCCRRLAGDFPTSLPGHTFQARAGTWWTVRTGWSLH